MNFNKSKDQDTKNRYTKKVIKNDLESVFQ